MRLSGWILLCFLLATSTASYQKDDRESEQEVDAVRRMVTNNDKLSKRLRYEEADQDQKRVSVDHVRRTNPSTELEHPVRIALFNAGDYYAYLKLNYVLNGLQDEQEIAVPIEKTNERDLLLPHAATRIRIRVHIEGFLKDQTLIDEQFQNFDDVKEICYLLAGNRVHPVYGFCAFPFAQYYQLWTSVHGK